MGNNWWIVLLAVAMIVIVFFAIFTYIQASDACEAKGGVLVKSGVTNICVEPR